MSFEFRVFDIMENQYSKRPFFVSTEGKLFTIDSKNQIKECDENYIVEKRYERELDKLSNPIFEGDIVLFGGGEYIVRFGDWDNEQQYEDSEDGCGWYLEQISPKPQHKSDMFFNIYWVQTEKRVEVINQINLKNLTS